MKSLSILTALFIIFSCQAAHAMSAAEGQECEKHNSSIAALDSAYSDLYDNLNPQDGDRFAEAMLEALTDSSSCDELVEKGNPIVAEYKEILDGYPSRSSIYGPQ